MKPDKFEQQPWYQEWKQSIDRVIAAQLRFSSTKSDTPEGQSASQDYQAALDAHREVAARLRDRRTDKR
jgi:hypothetical protein